MTSSRKVKNRSMRKRKLKGQQKEEEYNNKRNEKWEKNKERVQKRGIRKTQSIVDAIKNFFGGNLEKLDFPLNCNSKNRPFKKQ